MAVSLQKPPIQRAKEIGEDKMPTSCKSAYRAALANGWTVRCTEAIGYPTPGDCDPVKSVILKCERGASFVVATWEGPIDVGTRLGFHCAWEVVLKASGKRVPYKVGFREFAAIIREVDTVEPGT